MPSDARKGETGLVASKKTEVGSGHVNADSCTGQVVIVCMIGGV